MTATTSYGSWNRYTPGELTVEDGVSDALGDFAGDYDFEAICAEYRAAINSALPDGVALCGNEFYGPYYPEDYSWEGELDIGEIIQVINDTDFWAIIAKYDMTAAEPAAEQET